ncbi:MAG TPA: alpha/beta hydrolase [Symbiobacteriaceae bacterium]|nr:alpha/beta hydrolase [Symbiobacteriaceae bacterium]
MRRSRILLATTIAIAAALLGSGCTKEPKQPEAPAIKVTTITLPAIADVPRDQPWDFTLPGELRTDQVEGVAVLQGEKLLAINVVPKDGHLTITPAAPYERNLPHTLRIFAGEGKRYEATFTTQSYVRLKPGQITEVPASPSQGFHFTYYLYLPPGVQAGGTYRFLVAANDSNGNVSDALDYHAGFARKLLQPSTPARMLADELKLPLLVPATPYPLSPDAINLQALSRMALQAKAAPSPYLRVDLQVLAMLEDARRMLAEAGIKAEAKAFVMGSSAGGLFADRFALLHPEAVRAVAFGSTSGLMALPVAQFQGRTLRYPVGVADLKELAGVNFRLDDYMKVPRLVIMGQRDSKDWTRDSHAYEQADSELAHQLFGVLVPDRWYRMQAVAEELGLPVQFITYTEGGQNYSNLTDLVHFFAANNNNGEGTAR